MRPGAIEVLPGEPDYPYVPVRPLEVVVLYEANANEIADKKLKRLASQVDADAVINVEYNANGLATQFRASGLAVKKVPPGTPPEAFPKLKQADDQPLRARERRSIRPVLISFALLAGALWFIALMT